MEFIKGIEYTKDCRDFEYTGVDCCPTCHEDSAFHLGVVQVNGEPSLLCCQLRMFFYPSGAKLTPEEKLLRAIFGDDHHEREDNIQKWADKQPD